MLHARKLTLGPGGISAAKIICHYQSEHRITKKLERLIVKLTCLLFVTGRDLLMRPGTVSDGAFEQSTIFEFVGQNRFEEVQIGNRFGIFQNLRIIANAGSLSKNTTASGVLNFSL